MRGKRKLWIIIAAILALGVTGAGVWASGTKNPAGASLVELGTAAGQSYVYGYPLVIMDVTREGMLEAYARQTGRDGTNTFIHVREFPDEDFKAVVRPNLDTLYSNAWLDLSGGPLVMKIPDMGERYYLYPVMDAWTNVVATPGTRVSGPGPGLYLIAGTGYEGDLPEEMELILCPTNMAWILGRIQTNGPDDCVNVHPFQDGVALTPLRDYQEGAGPGPAAAVDGGADPELRPSHQVAEMDPIDFFERMARLMAENPPAPEDAALLEQLRLLGFEPGEPFDLKPYGFLARLAVRQGVNQARALLDEAVSGGGAATREGWEPEAADSFTAMGELGQIKTREGWSTALTGIGDYGADFAFRAGVALIGLGANLPEDSVYANAGVDISGESFDGAGQYILHFEADRLPPVRAFWSITLYDEEGFLIHNSIGRCALTDRDPLAYNEDGSLTLYIQAESPGAEREQNWLPAPEAGPFTLTTRLYWPEEAVLTGAWTVPGVQRVD